MAVKRIKDLDEATSSTTGDVVAIDGATTRRITVENLIGANLDAIKGLTSAADKVPYFTGSGTAGLKTVPAGEIIGTTDAQTLTNKTLTAPAISSPTGIVVADVTGALAKAGDTMTGALTLNADPASALQAATKQYVDNLAAGLDIKASVACATTANITISGEQTIDGILTSASRVLVKDQGDAAENGIYVSAAGSWARSTDMDAWAEVPGSLVLVEDGTANGDSGWIASAASSGTIGTDDIAWSQFFGTGLFQPRDDFLTSIAALGTAADKIIYTTGANTAAEASITAAGRAMVAAADAAAQAALLPAVVGDSGSGGTKGLVPAPASGDASKFFRGDGTFQTIPGGGDVLSTNNLSDVADAATALDNLGGSPRTRSINAQTGTTYTFVLTDAGKPCTFANASAVTVTVPPNSSVAFPVGTQIEVVQSGAGKVTLAQGSGVTINSLGSNKSIAGQYAGATLLKTATDTWLLAGSLIP